jgi:hypothetical protein
MPLLCVVVAACGRGGPGGGRDGEHSAGGGLINPCDLVTREDAQRILGATFDAGVLTEKGVVGQRLCVYHETGAGGGGAFLQVTINQKEGIPKASPTSPVSIFRGIKEAFPNAPQLEGVGQESFVAPPGAHVLHKGYYLTLSVGLMNPKSDRLLKEAGAVAVANLDRLTAAH